MGLFSGRRESSVPLSRLSSDSQALAKKLHGIYQEKEKAALQAAKKRKSMKVPELADNALDDMHMWKSSDGNEIEAMFVAADESVLTLVMKKNPSRPYEIPWNRLDEPSQALGEGLRRLKEKLMPKNPAYSRQRRALALTVKASGKGTTPCWKAPFTASP